MSKPEKQERYGDQTNLRHGKPERQNRIKDGIGKAATRPYEAERNAENKSKAKVEEAIRRAKGGEDFGKLARELSEDTATATQGGDLGFVGKGEMLGPGHGRRGGKGTEYFQHVGQFAGKAGACGLACLL